MYKLGPTQGTTNMGIIYIGSYVRHFLTELTQQHKSFFFDPIFYGT
jgi:hypothetical protein